VKELELRAPFMSKSDLIQEYESLDEIRCAATAFAERHCRKLWRGQVAFSPELNASRMRIRAWLLLLSKSKKKKVSSRLLKRTLKKANIPAEKRGLTATEIQQQLQEEYKTYYKIKGEATYLRQTALVNLAKALAEQGNLEKEKMIKALRDREQQRSTARKIKFLQGRVRTGSTTFVTVTDAQGNKHDITDQEELEKAILENNKMPTHLSTSHL
jgi:hypothetical protein